MFRSLLGSKTAVTSSASFAFNCCNTLFILIIAGDPESYVATRRQLYRFRKLNGKGKEKKKHSCGYLVDKKT